jgi:hypothetical protein
MPKNNMVGVDFVTSPVDETVVCPLAHRANRFNAAKAGATVFQYGDDAELQRKEHSEQGSGCA